jgi:hypothetical protein
LEKKVKPAVPREEPVDSRFYFIFRSSDGSISVKHGVWRSDLKMIADQLAICAACPEIPNMVLVARAPGKRG